MTLNDCYIYLPALGGLSGGLFGTAFSIFVSHKLVKPYSLGSNNLVAMRIGITSIMLTLIGFICGFTIGGIPLIFEYLKSGISPDVKNSVLSPLNTDLKKIVNGAFVQFDVTDADIALGGATLAMWFSIVLLVIISIAVKN